MFSLPLDFPGQILEQIGRKSGKIVVKVRQDELQQIWGGADGIGRHALADLQQ